MEYETDVEVPDKLVIKWIGISGVLDSLSKRIIECYSDGIIRYAGFPDRIPADTEHPSFNEVRVLPGYVETLAECFRREGFDSLTDESGRSDTDGEAQQIILDYHEINRCAHWGYNESPPSPFSELIRGLVSGVSQYGSGHLDQQYEIFNSIVEFWDYDDSPPWLRADERNG